MSWYVVLSLALVCVLGIVGATAFLEMWVEAKQREEDEEEVG